MPASPGGITSRLLKHLSRARKSLPAPSSSRNGRPYDDIKQAAKDVWRSTFGQLEREPVYETIPLRRPGGKRLPNGQYWHAREIHTSSSGAGKRASAPLVQNARFLASRLRPQAHSLRGPGMVSHTGLLPSPARTFATYGSAKFAHEIVGNVPLGFRALADRMKRREHVERQLSWRNKVKEDGRGGKIEKSLKRFEKMRGGSRFFLSDKEVEGVEREIKRVREYKKYFVLPQIEVSSTQTQENKETQLPLTLETTEEDLPTHDQNSTTYLLLPLSPSLAHLISLTPQPPSTTLEPSSYFHPPHPERMTHSLPSLSHSYAQHAQKLGPLLESLATRVHLKWEDSEPWLNLFQSVEKEGVEVRTILDSSSGEAEALRLCFNGWTRAGVEALVRSLNLDQEGEEWWYCYSIPSDPTSPPFSESGSIAFSTDDEEFSSPSQSMYDSLVSSSSSPSLSSLQEDGEEGRLTWEESLWRMPLLNERGETALDFTPDLDLEQVERSVWSEI